jgi:hypothetical protein
MGDSIYLSYPTILPIFVAQLGAALSVASLLE